MTMELVWVNKTAGTTHNQKSSSHLIRHSRRVEISSQRRRRVLNERFDENATDFADQAGTFISRQNAARDKETVTQTEDGSTFFLITHQEDFSAKREPCPRSSIDSLCSPAAVLDADQKTVIRYISGVWLPTNHGLQPNRFFGSFSLVWPGDDQYANTFLSSALQTSDARSLYALLAAGARKMRLSQEVMPLKNTASDVLALKAVKALRKSISGRGPPNDQLILDLAFLVLAELYARSPQRIAGINVYWQMVRDYVISIGGISKMRSIVICFVMSINALCSLTGITLPQLDVRRYPELLGLDSMDNTCAITHSKHAVIDEKITSALAQLDLRSQVINEGVSIITQLVDSIQNLPVPALDLLRAYLQQYLPMAVSSISSPLCLLVPPSISSSSDATLYTTADVAHFFARIYGNVMWWWHAALHFLPEDVRSTIEPPFVVNLAASQAWSFLDQVQDILKDEAWFVPSDLIVWVSAVGCLVVKDHRHWNEYRRSFIHMTKEKDIKDDVKLAKKLTRFLPLAVIDDDFVQNLRFLFEEVTMKDEFA